MTSPVTITTWNLQGSDGVDVQFVSDHLRAVGADVVFLQEVQRKQARNIARALGAASLRWSFKHQPPNVRAEGMAVVGVGTPVPVESRAITYRWRLWSWRRRILQRARFVTSGREVVAVHAHLSPHDNTVLREHEIREVISWAGPAPDALVVGDLNEGPGSPGLARLAAAGFQDAWDTAATRSGGPATNWSGARDRPPRQRLDFVWHGASLAVTCADVPDPPLDQWKDWGARSDHLPLTVVVV